MKLVPLAFALALALGASSGAQEPALDSVEESQLDRVPSPANPGAVLFSRDRELMHPGDPLLVVGLEQDGNSFRDRAPALFASDRTPLQVDAEVNYRRRLSMYQEAASFRVALPPADPAWAARRGQSGDARGASDDQGSGGGLQSWLVVLAVVVIGLLVGFWHRHRQARAEHSP